MVVVRRMLLDSAAGRIAVLVDRTAAVAGRTAVAALDCIAVAEAIDRTRAGNCTAAAERSLLEIGIAGWGLHLRISSLCSWAF